MRSIVVKTGGTEEDIRSRTFAILKPIGKSNVLSENTKFGIQMKYMCYSIDRKPGDLSKNPNTKSRCQLMSVLYISNMVASNN